MLKTLKKAGLSLLSVAMTCSMLTLTPFVKVNAATTDPKIDQTTFKVSVSGTDCVNDSTNNLTGDNIRKQLFDDSQTTWWQSQVLSTVNSTTTENTWLQIDLGMEYNVSRVDYHARSDNNFKATGNITGDVIVQLSNDAENWADATTYSADTLWGDDKQNPSSDYTGSTAVEFEPTLARYVRISGTEGYHWKTDGSLYGTNICIADLDIYGLRPDGTYNVASGLAADQIKAVFTADGTDAKVTSQSDRPLTIAVDGKIEGYTEFSYDETTPVSSYLQLDLGQVYTLTEIKSWFYVDTRTYNNVVVLIDETENFTEDTYTVVYNGDPDNVHNLGLEAGVARTEAETSEGRTFAIDSVNARYVRFYMYGSTASHKQNHIHEIQVYGKEAVVSEVDKVELETLIDLADSEYGSQNPLGAYSTASFDVYAQALAAAQALVDDETVSQATVDAAVEALQAAIDGLVYLEALRENVADARLSYDDESEAWNAGYAKAIESAIAAAEEVLASEAPTQDAVDTADEALGLAIDEAYEYADAYEALSDGIAAAQLAETEGKTEASVQALNDAIQAAQEALDGDIDAEDLLAKLAAVEAAVEALEDEVVAPAYDKEALKAVIDEAKAIIDEAGDLYEVYTEETAQQLEFAYSDAVLTYEDDGSDYTEDDDDFQTIIDEATQLLREAIDGLDFLEAIEEVDKEALLEIVEDNEALYTTDNASEYYTVESFTAFKEAYEAAVEVIDNVDATQDEVDDAVTNLANAIDDLEEATPPVEVNVNVEARYSSNRIYWEAVEGATSYSVTRGTTEDGEFVEIASGLTTTSYIDEDAPVGTQYFYEVVAVTENGAFASVRVQDSYATGYEALHEHAKDQLHLDYTDNMVFDGTRVETLSAEDTARVAAMNEGLVLLVYKTDDLSYANRQIIFNIKDADTETNTNASDSGNNPTNNVSYMVLNKSGAKFRYDHGYGLRATFNNSIVGEGWQASAVQHATYTSGNNVTHAFNGTTANGFGSANWNGFFAGLQGLDVMTVGGAINGDAQVATFVGKIAYITITDEMLSQEEMNEYTAAMAALMDNMVEPVDKTALQEVIAQYEALDGSLYTPDSWDAVTEIYEAAKAVDADEATTQDAVDVAKTNLETALTTLVLKGNKELLVLAINAANPIITVGNDAKTYSVASYNAFNNAYETAVSVNDDENATQDAIDAAVEALTQAQENLVDFTAIYEAIEATTGLNGDDYTVSSMTAVNVAKADAETVLLNEGATKDEVANAAVNLNNAVEALVNIVELKAVVAEADTKLADEYTEESWNVFAEAYNDANNTLLNADASKDEVTLAVENLTTAMAALEAKPEEPATNLALNKVPTAAYGDGSTISINAERPAAMATDGTIDTNNYCDFGQDSDQKGVTSAYLQVDLENVYALSSIKLWRYWNDGRTYNATVIVISETEDFANPTIIYNADANDIHGFGAGSDATYAETSAGKEFTFDEVNGRYVRVYQSGSTSGNTNHIVELEVYGKEIEQEPPVETVDKAALKAAIDAADALNVNEDNYTYESVEAFDAAYSEAVVIYADEEVTQEAVDEATEALLAAIEGLVPNEGIELDYEALVTALEDTYAEYEAGNADAKYTEESYNAFVAAYEAAQAVSETEDTTQEAINEATVNLITAYEALEENAPVETVDKAALKAAIDAADALNVNTDDYTIDSVEAFDAAYSEAVVIYADEEATQEAIDEATEALLTAIDGLTPYEDAELDFEALLAALEDAEEDYVAGNADAKYTEATWNAFVAAYEAAEAISEAEEPTQDAIDEAAANLVAAFEGLTLNVNKDALKASIDATKDLVEETYSIKSWANMQTALTAAQTVYDDANATQEQVDAAKAELDDKVAKLVDRSPLVEPLANALAKLAATDKYTPESLAALQAAYDDANMVYNNTFINYVQQDVYTHVELVNNAIAGLVELADKDALKATIDAANELVEETYSIKSWANMQEALTAAQTVYDDANATQEQVDAAKAELEAKVTALVDRSPLVASFAEAESYLAQTDKYTEESLANLQEKYNGAQTLYTNTFVNYVQQDVYTHVERIAEAIAALEEKPVVVPVNKDALNALIAQAEAINADDYTTDSYENLATVLGVAKDVAADENATQEEVDAVVGALQAAIDSLVEKPKPTAPEAVTVSVKQKNYQTVTLTWEAVEGATEYEVYRKAYKETSVYTLNQTVTGTKANVKGLMTGKEYSFYVVAKNEVGSSDNSNEVKFATQLEGVPTLTIEQTSATKFTLRWTAIDGATRYIIYRKRAHADKEYNQYRKVLTLKGSVLEYTTAEMPHGDYSFIVKAGRYDSKDRVMTDKSNAVEGKVDAVAPTVTVKSGTKKATISWKKMSGVTTYIVYRSTSKNGSYKKLVTTKETSVVDTGLSKGKTYYYKVKGYKLYKSGTELKYNVYTPTSDPKKVTIK